MQLVLLLIILISVALVNSQKPATIPQILREFRIQDLKAEWECSSSDYTSYNCCGRVIIKDIQIDSLACFNTTSLADNKAKFIFSMDKRVYWTTTVSERETPPFCFTLPNTGDILEGCFKFQNLTWSNNFYSGCADLSTNFFGIKILTSDFGCYNISRPVKFNQFSYYEQDTNKTSIKIEDSRKINYVPSLPTWRCDYTNQFRYDCCANIAINELSFISKSCFNITSSGNDTARFTFNMNNKVYFDHVISAKSSLEYCGNMPFSAYSTQLCVKFDELSWNDTMFTGCADLTTYVMGIEIGSVNLGCFETNKPGIKPVEILTPNIGNRIGKLGGKNRLSFDKDTDKELLKINTVDKYFRKFFSQYTL